MLEILAAIGFVEGLKWCSAVLQSRFGTQAAKTYKPALTVIACVVFFFIQVMPVLTVHPYYGTYYNACWKMTDITKIITVGSDVSGLDLAAKYLNSKKNATQFFVQVSSLGHQLFGYYFIGTTYSTGKKYNTSPTPSKTFSVDYEVVHIRDSQIGIVPQKGTLNGQLEHVITLNGLDLVWIYQVTEHQLDREENP